MSTSRPGKVKNDAKRILRRNIAEIEPLLDLDGVWTTRDTDADVRDMIVLLKQQGAIVNRGRMSYNRSREKYGKDAGSMIVNKWEWRGSHKEFLQELSDDRQTFPDCEHSPHICNPREVDGYSCRKCIDNGEYPEYSRETLEELGVVNSHTDKEDYE